MVADHHVGLALLHLLRERELAGPARVALLDQRIRGLLMDLCGGRLVGGVDLVTTPISDYFALDRLKEANLVRCEGLVVRGTTAPGRALPVSNRGIVAP